MIRVDPRISPPLLSDRSLIRGGGNTESGPSEPKGSLIRGGGNTEGGGEDTWIYPDPPVQHNQLSIDCQNIEITLLITGTFAGKS